MREACSEIRAGITWPIERAEPFVLDFTPNRDLVWLTSQRSRRNMGFLSWIVFGLIAGLVAKWIMPGKDPGGFIITILIGVAGAFVGGFIGSLIGFGGISGFDLRSMATAIVGALVLLFGYRQIKNKG